MLPSLAHGAWRRRYQRANDCRDRRVFSERAPKLRRRSIKDTAQRLRAFVRFLHATGRIPRDISTQIISPTMYAYESIPSALSREEIEAALTTTRKDRSALGLRDYAILMLLATYGVRAGEIMQLRLDDIDWRAETLRIRHTKTRGQTMLPLTAPVGEALLEYLDQARPKTDRREVFLRAQSAISAAAHAAQRGAPTVGGSRCKARGQNRSARFPPRTCRSMLRRGAAQGDRRSLGAQVLRRDDSVP